MLSFATVLSCSQACTVLTSRHLKVNKESLFLFSSLLYTSLSRKVAMRDPPTNIDKMSCNMSTKVLTIVMVITMHDTDDHDDVYNYRPLL